ncbi:hypothetical protein ACHAXT_008444 [Thalassiosira profunda]
MEAPSVAVVGPEDQRPPLVATAEELQLMLNVIEREVLPQTRESVAKHGNKVFGAAILNPDYTCAVASTNAETDCPLFHGEVKCIYDWSQRTPPSQRGSLARQSIFLCTHEPCCMCVASILWSGFNKIFYFFPYATTSAQGIPHDINTMHELWGVASYRKRNKYFASACLQELIEGLEDDDTKKKELKEQSERLLGAYNAMAEKYHREKADNANNTLVLD